jgi:putative secretion ATPase (PEP-CTERM system associated)
MYEQFFDLKKKPFELVPNPEFIYFSRTHKRSHVFLDYGVKERAGFILLTGEVGSGKTTLINHLMKKNDDNIMYAKVFNTKVDSTQLISMINDDFGLGINNKDKVMLIRDLNDFLIDRYSKGYYSTLIIDEAQNLSADLLEEIRMLSNLETKDTKLLQIVLSGQPDLRNILLRPDLRQLRQRISISCHIKSMSHEETEQYIYHRLEIAGNKKAVAFADGVIQIIHHFSRGIPRLINIVCDLLMLSAFVDETREISIQMTQEIVNELDMENQYWKEEISDEPESEQKKKMVRTSLEKANGFEISYRYEGAISDLKHRCSRLEKRLEKIAFTPRPDDMVTRKIAMNVEKDVQKLNRRVKDIEKSILSKSYKDNLIEKV